MMSEDFERGLEQLRADAARAHSAQTMLPTGDLVRRARRNRRTRAAAVTVATAAAVAGLGLGTVAAVDWFGADAVPPAGTPAVPESEEPVLADPDAPRLVDERSAIPGDPLVDGDYMAILYGVDPDARTVDVDLAVFYGGQAAIDWLTANEPDAENPPMNDYILVNEVEQVQTLPLTDNARIWDWCFGPDLGHAQRELAEWAAAPIGGAVECDAGPALSRSGLVWLEIRGGEIIQVVGQYVP